MLIIGLAKFIDSDFFLQFFPDMKAVPTYINICLIMLVLVVLTYIVTTSVTIGFAIHGLKEKTKTVRFHVIHIILGLLFIADMINGFRVMFFR